MRAKGIATQILLMKLLYHFTWGQSLGCLFCLRKKQKYSFVYCTLVMLTFIEASGAAAWGILAVRQTGRAEGGAGGWRGWWSVGLADISVSSSLPAVHGIKWTCSNGNSSSGFSVEQLVQQILDSHQTKPPPRTHNCLCTGTLGKG